MYFRKNDRRDQTGMGRAARVPTVGLADAVAFMRDGDWEAGRSPHNSDFAECPHDLETHRADGGEKAADHAHGQGKQHALEQHKRPEIE